MQRVILQILCRSINKDVRQIHTTGISFAEKYTVLLLFISIAGPPIVIEPLLHINSSTEK